jgi:N-acetylglucosamine-6-phosphate deacetylase
MTAYRGRNAFTGERVEVEVLEGRIIALRPGVRETGLWIAPGLVDLQVNGSLGIDLNDPGGTVEDVRRLVRVLAARGTTTLLPTIVTAAQEAMVRIAGTIAEARRVDAMVAHAVPSLHLEGPAISPVDGYRGAHPLEHVRAPSLAEFDAVQAACDGLVGMVTISPHWDGSVEFIRGLCARGVAVSMGHTDATPEQIRAAADAGARLSTHLGNGIAPILARHPNPIWTQLADDRLTASFIADGVHLAGDALRAMLRAKGVGRAVLVSDSVALAGSAAGEYKARIGGDVVVRDDGAIAMRETGLLAGSGIALKDAVARCVRMTGIALGDAVAMATVNPGRFAGNRGLLEVGAVADLMLFRWEPGDDTLAVEKVMIQGVEVGIA